MDRGVDPGCSMGIQLMFNTNADLYRPSHATGPLGGTSSSFLLTKADFPCRISNATPGERRVGDLLYAEASGVVYAPHTLDIQRGDEVRHGSLVYEVLGVRVPSKRFSHKEVIVERKQRSG